MAKIRDGIIALSLAAAAGTGIYEGTVSDGPRETVLPGELVAERTANAKVFRPVPGKKAALLYTEPVHWRDPADSAWKSIDLEMREKPILRRLASDKDYEIVAGPWRADFSDEKTGLWGFKASGAEVNWEALFEGEKDVSIFTDARYNGIKEMVTIGKSAPDTLIWKVSIYGSLGDYDENSGWGILNHDGETVCYVAPIRAWDAAGNEVRCTVIWEGDELWVIPDRKKAVFPVTIDPSTIVNTNSDGSVYKFGSTFSAVLVGSGGNYATQDTLWVGAKYLSSWAISNYQLFRSALQFPVAATYGNIDSLVLWLRCMSIGTSAPESLAAVEAELYTPPIGTTGTPDDYSSLQGWGKPFLSIISGAGISAGNYVSMKFTTVGIDSFKSETGDTLKIALPGRRDFRTLGGPEVPDTTEVVAFYSSSDTGGGKPYLMVYYVDPDPTGFTMTAIDPDSVLVSWTDNSFNETMYRIRRYVDNVVVDSVGASVISKRIGGLDANTKYAWYVECVGGNGDGKVSAADSVYTKANTPGAPTRTEPADSLVKIVVDPNGNPAWTRFAVAAIDSEGNYWHLDFRRYPRVLRSGQPHKDSTFHYVVYDSTGGAGGVTFQVGVGKWYNFFTRALSGE